MKTIEEYKDDALEALSGNWITGAVATFIYTLIFGGVPCLITLNFSSNDSGWNSGDTMSNIVTILLLPLLYGYYIIFLSVYRKRNARIEQLFDGFKNYGKVLGTLLLTSVYIVLWSILLLIPGIIKAYSYSMTPYVMNDNPSLKYNAAIEESMRLMEGHKMQLFLLDLSMIGWVLLSCLTLGIGFLFLEPYNQTAHAAFYQDLLAENSSDSFDDNSNSFNESSDYEEPVDGPDFEEVK